MAPGSEVSTPKTTCTAPYKTNRSLHDLPLEILLMILYNLLPRKCLVRAGRNGQVSIETHHRHYSSLVQDPTFNVTYYQPLSRDDDRSISTHRKGNSTSILCVSKQISNVCLDILYRENYFLLNLYQPGPMFFGKKISEQNRRRIRYLLVVAYSIKHLIRDFKPAEDEPLYASIFANLRTCRIILTRPDLDGRCRLSLWMWTEWLRRYLECFARHLPSEAILEVDVNEMEEMSTLIKEWFPREFQIVRCQHVGDDIFEGRRPKKS